ncbi:transforming growth factor-beta-induced protein ig-h3 [Caerostris extrusa]|uniref:Transforming growth factor-beta-induced protein ig-h3 n=1 Tax=Caerostris extrusa TaxID=172846 RepID=A0AAV4PCI8_CAEEX|nr:transforming growth factor-beta-induced protein ig-h3 [Caerostris extrusa]
MISFQFPGGTFTILAPDDDAFGYLSPEFNDILAANRTLAERILLNHILPGSLYTGGITDGLRWETVGGEVIVFTTKRGLIFANDIPIIIPDVPFTNGVIHVLNRVLLPDGVDADCHCKPSGSSSPRQPSSQQPGGARPPPGQPPRPFVQGQTTRRPGGQTYPRQTNPPFGRQPPTATTGPVPRPGIPGQQPQRPFTPSRIGPTSKPLSQPNQITRSPYDRRDPQSQPEDDLNTVAGPGTPSTGGQWQPEPGKTTRYPPSSGIPTAPSRVPGQPPRANNLQEVMYSHRVVNSLHGGQQPPRSQPPPRGQQPPSGQQPTRGQQPSWGQPPRGQQPQTVPGNVQPPSGQQPSWGQQPPRGQPQTVPGNVEFPEQEITPVVTSPPRTTSRWANRQPTQATRYPTPPRSPYRTQATTRRPQTTRSYERITPNLVGKVSQPEAGLPQTFTTSPQQVTQPTRRPSQQRTTVRPSRPVPQPQRRPTPPRPGSFPTPSQPAVPTEQPPFESNRQKPRCRQRWDILTPDNQNLPICPDSGDSEPCQRAPYNPSDRRPLCPDDIVQPGQPGCRDASDPFNPSDTRPQCPPSPPGQGCRIQGQPTYAGDRRPFCSPSPPNQVGGCRDLSVPFNPSDNRPLCDTTNPPDLQTQGCRKNSEPQDGRPLCPGEEDYPMMQRKDNPDPESYHHHNNDQHILNLKDPESPNTQTTRRQSWQTTQAPQDITNQVFNPGQPPASGNLRPPSLPSQGGSIPGRPPTGSNQPSRGSVTQSPFALRPTNGPYPNQPQTGNQPIQPQTVRPQSPGISRPYQPPQGGSRTTTRTQSQVGFTQTPSYPQNQPNRQTGSADVQPNQPFTPQRRPVPPSRLPVGSVTSYPERGTSTPRVPISVTGTTTAGEDSRRTLYEIVEDPALLIRGTPVKLTKIFSLFHKAGIEDILSGPGPTTVFLPSDDAFATLPKGVVDQLEENPELLRQVLLYHVANMEILPSPGGESYTVPSLEGNQLVITMLNGGRLIFISGAKAIAVTRANNGIFYVINQLLYPLPHQNIVGAIQSRPDLSTLSMLLDTLAVSGFTDFLQGTTPYTFLAPTDNAFAQLSPAVLEELSRNTTALQEILMNHIIEGAHYGREFLAGGTFPSARGGKLKFQVVSYGYQVNEINIKTPEIVTGTGVVHLIDQIILEDSDLKFFNTLDNTVNGQDDSRSNNQQPQPGVLQPFQQPQQQPGTRPGSIPVPNRFQPGSTQPTTGGQRLPQGQSQATGLMPSPGHRQSIGGQATGQLRPTGGQTTGQLRPTGGQTTSQLGFTGGQTHTTGHTSFSGHSQTSGQASLGGRRPAGQSTFTGQRQPSFQPQTLPVAQIGPGDQTNVADLARSMGLNRFAEWMTNTGLLEKIQDGGVYTVFAPTDDAINSLPQDMVYSIGSNPEQTKPLLQYHIVPRRININSLSNDETSSTLLQGKSLRFNVYSTVQPDCKQLVTAAGAPIGDALATMGTIQVIPITQVLYQPTGNLLNIVEASPILQSLAQAIKSAHLSWVISGTTPC